MIVTRSFSQINLCSKFLKTFSSQTQSKNKIKTTITQSDVKKFSQISGDTNPLHIDKQYAQKSIFKQRISHGMLPMGFIQKYFSQQKMKIKSMQIKFMKPIYLQQQIVININFKDQINQFSDVLNFEAQIKKSAKKQMDEQSLTLVTLITGKVQKLV